MKDYSQSELESSRPFVGMTEAVEFCFECLVRDKKHYLSDEVVDELTFEGLVGALLLVRDHLKEVTNE
jgi:hypothetical protein